MQLIVEDCMLALQISDHFCNAFYDFSTQIDFKWQMLIGKKIPKPIESLVCFVEEYISQKAFKCGHFQSWDG